MSESAQPQAAAAATVDNVTADAVGVLGEAIEYLDRVRGALVEFHQLTGRVDLLLQDAADRLDGAGHSEQAQLLRAEAIGRDVLEGRWTFQIVEEFTDGYDARLREIERLVREALIPGGHRHVHEARMKEREQKRAAKARASRGAATVEGPSGATPTREM